MIGKPGEIHDFITDTPKRCYICGAQGSDFHMEHKRECALSLDKTANIEYLHWAYTDRDTMYVFIGAQDDFEDDFSMYCKDMKFTNIKAGVIYKSMERVIPTKINENNFLEVIFACEKAIKQGLYSEEHLKKWYVRAIGVKNKLEKDYRG